MYYTKHNGGDSLKDHKRQ